MHALIRKRIFYVLLLSCDKIWSVYRILVNLLFTAMQIQTFNIYMTVVLAIH